MSGGVLIAIRPKWCEMIANSKKTVEVRKTRPKKRTPFKCYIYCTKPSKAHQTICGCFILNDDELFKDSHGRLKYGDSIELMAEDDITENIFLNGKVIGEFVCDQIFDIEYEKDEGYSENYTPLGFSDCLDDETFDRYLGKKNGYGWHISAMKIYDKPKKLSDFKRHDPTYDYSVFGEVSRTYTINRPPQSWCYVVEREANAQ